MKLFILFLIPFLLFAKPFKVASYNVENLFDDVYNGTEYDEFIPGRHNWTKAIVRKKLLHTAEVLCDIDADIVGLQEVENEHIFHRLSHLLQRSGCGYRYEAITHKKGTPIQVALLSRFPIRHIRELQVSYSPRVRNILEVEVSAEGYPLTIFVNHWKSKSRKGYESKRIAYAKTLAKRLSVMPQNKDYIILGDFNTDYDAYLSLDKRLDDTHGRIGMNDLLQTVVNGQPVTETTLLHTMGAHYDLWLELPYAKRWSHMFYGRKSTLDHILLPASMVDGKGIDYVNDSFNVFKADYLFTKKSYINSWEMKGGRHTGKGYSDHLPIYALFDTKPYRKSNIDYAKPAIGGTIATLYDKERLDVPVEINNAVVVLKRGRYAVLKDAPKGRGIFVFGAVRGLEEGERYDIKVRQIHTYKGLKEITDMVVLKDTGAVDVIPYYSTALANPRQNEVVRNLAGLYRKGYLYTQKGKIPIYFKNHRITPKNGSRLKIAVAHIGYYKRIQLVVYSRKDFSVLE
jgi:endonuclease/exonuclease/phosphatase family metal-dependent hydrolase